MNIPALADSTKNKYISPGPGRTAFAMRLAVGFACALLAVSPTVVAQNILGDAEDFAVLGGSTVTNTGPTVVSGELGVSPGTAITGFPPGTVVGGTIHSNDAAAVNAHAAAVTAYNILANEAFLPGNNLSGQDLGTLTLTSGVYHFNDGVRVSF